MQEEASAVSEISEWELPAVDRLVGSGTPLAVLMPRSGEEEAYHWAPLLCGIGALLTHTAGDLGEDFEVVHETSYGRCVP